MSASFEATEWVWRDGEFVPWEEATLHAMSHVVHYGSSVFEGIRCYETPRGPAVFRLSDHVDRLMESCRVYRMEPVHSRRTLEEAVLELIRRNEMGSCYVRPVVYRGYGAPGLDPSDSPLRTLLFGWPWGEYLGEGALEEGVDACVSTWSRPAPNTYPVASKAGGHYVNAQLMKMEAVAGGYAEAIALGPGGRVSEGSGQNVFLVRDGSLLTPEVDGTFLAGITRETVLDLAGDLGIPVRETPVPREWLYTSEEIFFTGTASEITPVRSVDGIPVGEGDVGSTTRRLQRRYMEVVHGRREDRRDWLAPVHPPTTGPDGDQSLGGGDRAEVRT